MFACFLAVMPTAAGDPGKPPSVVPDPPERERPPTAGPGNFRPSWDLDGWYLWLGPTGAASHIEGEWDSTFGGHLALVRVRERDRLGTVGAVLGATLWTERGGGRLWLDGIAGTRILRMVGVTAGPMVELSALAHPRFGGSVGVWAFLGVTPFVRIGAVEDLGAFAEIGVHLALPVVRR